MKGVSFFLVILICLGFVLSACQNGDTDSNVQLYDPATNPAEPTTPSYDSTEPPQQTQTALPTELPTEHPTEPPAQPTDPETGLPVYVPGSIQLQPRDAGELAPPNRQYRLIYYMIPSAFTDLLDEEETSAFHSWANAFSVDTNFGETQNEMCLVAFVKEFNISIEEFNRALAEYLQSYAHQLTTEFREPPNADIIYTFDNEIINEYYRYE